MTKTNSKKSRKTQAPASTFGVLSAATPDQMSRYTSTGQQIVEAARASACDAVHTQVIEASLGQPGKQLAKFIATTTWHDTHAQAAARCEAVEDRAFARVFEQRGSALGDFRAVTWVLAAVAS